MASGQGPFNIGAELGGTQGEVEINDAEKTVLLLLCLELPNCVLSLRISPNRFMFLQTTPNCTYSLDV